MAIKKFNPKGLDSASNVQILTTENLLSSNIVYSALTTVVGNITGGAPGSPGGIGATGATGPAGPPGSPGTGGNGSSTSVTISNTSPVSPSVGSFWFNSDSGEIFVYYNDGTTDYWVQPMGAAGPTGDPGSPGATGSAGAPGTPGTIWTRSTTNATTSGIANNTTANIDIAGFKGYNLYKITSTHAAWIRLYTSAAARTADSSRAQGTDPTPDTGVVTEVITNASPQTIVLAPAVLGFNDENPVTTTIPVAVTNLSGGSAAITVTLTLLKTED
jgi:hypothetical protein